VHKAKDIIPEIARITVRPKDRTPIVLINCPKCGGDLEMQGVRLTCTNIECSADLFTEHFCKTIGIKGLAIKSIEKLSITHPLDLYDLTVEFLNDRLGKNGGKIFIQIRDSKKVDVVKLLCALNIPAVKSTKLNKIFSKFPDLKVLGDFDRLVEVEGMGNRTAEIVTDWYNNFDATIKPITESIGFDLNVQKQLETAKLVAVTGKLPGMSRKEFTNMMVAKGINVQSLTKNTLCLITGEKPGEGNVSKAIKYGIQIIPYHNFIKSII